GRIFWFFPKGHVRKLFVGIIKGHLAIGSNVENFSQRWVLTDLPQQYVYRVYYDDLLSSL
ncbi:hypothetical protein E4U27_000323, partial [Claviceps purpurea]